MSLRQTCKNWQADGSCKFASKCRFQHGDSEAARCTESNAINCKNAAPNATQSLITAASGSAIHLPRSASSEEWLQIVGKRSPEFGVELSRRFLLALLRPLLPHLADPLARTLCELMPIRNLFFIDRFSDDTPGDFIYRMVRKKIAFWLRTQAAQATGYARLVRMCHVEHHVPTAQNDAEPCEVFAFRPCSYCQFPNDDLQSQTCILCKVSSSQFMMRNSIGAKSCQILTLAPEQALKTMRKLEKKLNQVLCLARRT
jgi:hypothetical protein